MNNVTLLLPVKNGANYLLNSLTNLAKIAEEKDEILIINDFSTDNSVDIIRGFQDQDQRISMVNTNNSGLVNALNLGIKELRITGLHDVMLMIPMMPTESFFRKKP